MPPRYNRQLNTILATVKERCHMDQLGFLGSRCRTRKSLCNPGRRRGLWHECQFRSKRWCCFSSLGQVNFKYHKFLYKSRCRVALGPWDLGITLARVPVLNARPANTPFSPEWVGPISFPVLLGLRWGNAG